ncbi:Glucosylceramidase [Chionoecetes opilio]|uniref:Glucosylceramidase n=1 Tax=Chionoecetes opilio TaxID=41210 RepID=A0A8J5CIV6_CHIOP|nr:Glucosylceramidase [Chionoecetes opilio]
MSATHYYYYYSLLLLTVLTHSPAQATATQESSGDDGSCHARVFPGGDSPVCMCTAAHCPPLLPHILTPTPTHAHAYTSSRSGWRFRKQSVAVHGPNSGREGDRGDRGDVVVVEVACVSPQQTMTGFGGSISDSAAITMNSLSPATLDALLRAYFSPEGLEYNLLRVPIGGSDFSVRPYTLDDGDDDVTLKHFALSHEDTEHKAKGDIMFPIYKPNS